MIGRQVFAVIAAAGLLGLLPCAALADSAPAAAASPPKTIIEVHTSPLCQMLHEAVQPTLTGLMKNDSVLEVSNKAFAKMFADQAAGARESADNDRLFLRNAAGALTHNLKTISDLLGHQFPQDNNAASHATEELMKVRLQAVAAAQNDALNLIEGYVQTADMGQARDEFPGGHQSGANEVEAPGTPFVDMAGLDGTLLHGVTPKTAVPAPVSLLGLTRSRVTNLEEPAGTAIMAAVQVCNSPQPAASPH